MGNGEGLSPPAIGETRRGPGRLASGWQVITGQGARGGALAAADQAVLSLTNFVAAILLGRQVEPTEFGVYAVGYLGLHLARAVQDGLLIQPLSSLAPGMSPQDFRRHVSGAAALQLAAAAASSAFAAALGALLIRTGNDVAGPTVLHLWFVLLVWQPQEFVRRVFYARGQVRAALANSVAASLVRVAVLAGLLRAGALQGVVGLHAIGWGALAGVAIGLVQTRTVWTASGVSLRRVWREQWAIGRWVTAATVGNWLTLEVYPLLTAGLVSFAAAGAYRALQTIVAPVHAFLRTVDTFFTPRMALRFDRAGRKAVARQVNLLYIVGGIPIAFGLGLVALEPQGALRLFYGEVYTAYPRELVWMTAFYGLWLAYSPLQIALKAVRRTRPIFVANTVALGLMLTIGVAAIRALGVLGTVAGQTLGAAAVGILVAIGWRNWLREEPAGQAPDRDPSATSSAANDGESSRPSPAASEARTPGETQSPAA